jgi:serine/threonine protein phosphatase PrpC
MAPDVASQPGTAVFAVFDGHGGAYTSKYCEKHFLPMLGKSAATTSVVDTHLTPIYRNRKIE